MAITYLASQAHSASKGCIVILLYVSLGSEIIVELFRVHRAGLGSADLGIRLFPNVLGASPRE